MPKRSRQKRKPHHQKKQLVHPTIWGLFAILLSVGFVLVMLTLESPTVTGNAAIQQIAFFQGGQDLLIEPSGLPGLEKINLEIKETVKNGNLVFREEPRILFRGTAYSKIAIITKNIPKVGTVSYWLKLRQKNLREKGLRPEEIRLYVNGQEAQTTLLKQEGEYYYYEAKSSGLGDLVIGKKKVDTVLTPSEGTMRKSIAPMPAEEQRGVLEEEPKDIPPEVEQQPLPRQNLFGKVVAFLRGWLK